MRIKVTRVDDTVGGKNEKVDDTAVSTTTAFRDGVGAPSSGWASILHTNCKIEFMT